MPASEALSGLLGRRYGEPFREARAKTSSFSMEPGRSLTDEINHRFALLNGNAPLPTEDYSAMARFLEINIPLAAHEGGFGRFHPMGYLFGLVSRSGKAVVVFPFQGRGGKSHIAVLSPTPESNNAAVTVHNVLSTLANPETETTSLHLSPAPAIRPKRLSRRELEELAADHAAEG